MDTDTLHSLVTSAPMAISMVIMSAGNFTDKDEPVLSNKSFKIFRTLSFCIGAIGLLAAFGVFNSWLEDSDRLWGSYLFSAIFLNVFLYKVHGKYISDSGKHKSTL